MIENKEERQVIMGMGHFAAFAEVIEESTLEKFCPKEFSNFMMAVHDSDENFSEVARNLELEEDEVSPNIVTFYKQLQEAFKKKTGLICYIGYHNEDDGDRYDEVRGVYWNVDGMYQLTPAGKKMKKYVERKFFVTYG